MPQPEQPHTILLVHCHYRLPGGEDAVFAAERAMLQAHGHRVITYERNNDAGGLAQKLLLPLRAVYSIKTVREVRALIRKEQVDLVHVHNTLLTISPSVFQACFKEHVPAVQTLHNFRIFCPNGILMRDGHVCEECPQHGLGCAVRHSCYRGSRAQSLVCAGIYAFHRLLGTYRNEILGSLAPDYIDGLSLLGGEPFEPENQRALVPFLHEVRVLYPHKTIWCYTGNVYETELLQPSHARCEVTDEMLSLIDVLVDGEFIPAQHDISLRFRGSGNQRIIDLNATRAAGHTVLWQDDPLFADHKM